MIRLEFLGTGGTRSCENGKFLEKVFGEGSKTWFLEFNVYL
jgi:hypothetical protein